MQWTKIREARRQAAMTQAQLAETSGVSRATIARLEKGAEGPFPGTIQKIASALEVRPLDILDQEPPINMATVPTLSDKERRHREEGYRRGYRQGYGAAIDQLVTLMREERLSLEDAYDRCFAHRFVGLLQWQHFIHPDAEYFPPSVPRPERKRAGGRR
jgi:transcriptional regulator with XRE-family HTH domain